MAQWQEFPDNKPTDEEVVYVRTKYWSYITFKATWSESNQNFTSLYQGIIYPAWTISRFKSLT